MILFVNACVRKSSRTKVLAEELLSRFEDEIVEHDLIKMQFPKVTEDFINWREERISRNDFDSPVFDAAKDFARADAIVIAAPYYDLSFPSSLKQYIEQICVRGLTFYYTADGQPKGLCRAKRVYYVMSAGGTYVPEEYGYGYIRTVAAGFFEIPETVLIKSVGLDIVGADAKAIMEEAKNEIAALSIDDLKRRR